MNIENIVFYVLDAVIFAMLIKMTRDSGKIEIKTKVASRWIIPAIFWGIALLSFFSYNGIFRIVQVSALVLMGVIYATMNSGLSKEGIVMIGRLYPWKKCTPIQVKEEEHCIIATIRKAPSVIPFEPEQMKEVRSFLSKNAGLAKKEVRTKK